MISLIFLILATKVLVISQTGINISLSLNYNKANDLNLNERSAGYSSYPHLVAAFSMFTIENAEKLVLEYR